MTDLLATIVSFPTPLNIPDTGRAADLLDTWRTHMGTNPDDGTGDFEDFFEMAARLDAALHSGAKTWIHDARSSTAFTADGDTCDVEGLHQRLGVDVVGYGPVLRHSRLEMMADTRPDRYFHSPAFTDHAGRKTLLTGFRADCMEVAAAMVELAEAGQADVIVKATKAKHGIWRVPTSTDVAEAESLLLDATEWAMVAAEGISNAFSVQEIIEMHYEYRVFIVDGIAVTGAGCIEEHTPLDNTTPFDPAVRRVRGSAEPVEFLPNLVDEFIVFASEVAAQAGSDMPQAYVIDVAQSNGRPVVIEFNGMTNAGLYASDPRLVTRALVT